MNTLLNNTSSILYSTKFLSSTSIPISNGTNSIVDSRQTIIPEKYQIILLSFAYGIISLLSVIGNSSIIYIVLRNRRMHSVTNYFICNLALADCLVACFAVPFQVSIFYRINIIDIIIFFYYYYCLVSSSSFTKMGFTTFSV
jgi:hypothetical protein